ncbi:MAG: OB-fold nucleic acid binding domain-containing protein, partial [Acidithiobacillus sp.]
VGQSALLAGLVVARRSTRTKRGDRIYFLTLDDGFARVEVVAFAEAWAAAGKMGEGEDPVLVYGEVSEDSYAGGLRVSAQRLLTLEAARAELAGMLCLDLHKDVPVAEIAHAVQRFPGTTPLRFRVHLDQVLVTLRAGEGFAITVSNDLLEALARILPGNSVTLSFRPPSTLVHNVISLDRARQGTRRPA